MAYDPLFGPEETTPEPASLEGELRLMRKVLAETASLNIHSHNDMLQAAVALDRRVRGLLAALGAEPDVTSSTAGASERCPAAHPEDPTPCDGPPVVTVLDAHNAGANGCEHHGARLLASLEGGRVYALPDAPEGAAIRVFKAAGGIRPFCWYEDAPRTAPNMLSLAETRRGGEGR
ncbi:hypothetical protein ACFYZJ_37800 [Streptomyces sp. NPDC001848]|uniref:hypothetical protein n=1 Tax=Streptomyces sp. NPDC001848 TaxID=3364618 RepID=UPI0036B99239